MTKTLLLFYRGDNMIFQVSFTNISQVSIARARWGTSKTGEQLILTCDEGIRSRTLRLQMEQPEEWREWIEQRVKQTSAGGDQQ